ncbi:MAG: TonB-dependent receptor [Candidatus Omnitrophota bacterium]
MKSMIKKIFVLFCMIVFMGIPGRNVFAANYDLGSVLVSATKTEQYQSQIGSSTTVITESQLKKSGKTTIAEVLKGLPGITVSQNGNMGGLTYVNLRGSQNGQTLVLIDGVETYDPMTASRGFDFAHLTTDNIERIEIVRGPQSTLYGSSAMGGVINIITKQGKGKPAADVSFEAGSHNTFRESIGARGSEDGVDYSIALSRMDSEGLTNAKDGRESDKYQNTSVSTRIGVNVFDNSKLTWVSRYTEADYDLDDGAYSDDPNYTAKSELFSSKLEFAQHLQEAWTYSVAYSFLNMERNYRDPADSVDTTENEKSRFIGNYNKFETQHNISFSDIDEETFGAEYKVERGSSTSSGAFGWSSSHFDRRTFLDRAYYAQSRLNFDEEFIFTAGMRIDDYQLYGNKDTYKLSALYAFPETDTKLRASYGTGFKSPSLYQLYSIYGNTTLSPEESWGYDAGIEQYFFDGKITVGVTGFNTNYKNLIAWQWPQYVNVQKAITRGYEWDAKAQLKDNLTLGSSYTYTKTKDKSITKELARRPKNQAKVYADWDCSQDWNINIAARYIGTQWDDSANTNSIKRSIIFDLASSYAINGSMQIFGRVENLSDRDCESVRGYAGFDRAVFAGVKGEF